MPRKIGAFLLDCDEDLGVAQLVQEVRLEFPKANEGEIADGAAVAQSIALKSVSQLDEQIRTLGVLPELLDPRG